MKTSRAQVEQNRQLILKAAAELFRLKGFDGVKVAEVMQAASLTHGGFYNYFDSKEALIAETCSAWVRERAESLEAKRAADPDGEALAYVERYLSRRYRDHPDMACLYPALCADIARQPDTVRHAFTEDFKGYLTVLERLFAGDTANEALPQTAIVRLSTLIGAMTLARAVDDPALSDAILETVRAELTAKA
ncbi:TetR/AcrR family transcriptional regulator [Asticcacaulis sp. BYS171W]|uniref:TetR/AcrR family transcriptional regulator n=1 Tax=Asticcacaulis aquaticus TaxID=2984212 RepID=A0ABT5HY02_9CAUL|nr:TetR/AcrR family transcriptional regulator [Asticcacaulis aquaticus]MDC7684903.1 TetR/AcrR family transcriptional regulator [Asticcacaulis aquaticus]